MIIKHPLFYTVNSHLRGYVCTITIKALLCDAPEEWSDISASFVYINT